MIRFDFYPEGKRRALTMSYDDGKAFDLRLAEIFDRNGIRGTFHLNSAKLDTNGFLKKEDLGTALARHEISVHTLTHPHLELISGAQLIREVLEDRKNLEAITGAPVVGMSYPFGTYTQDVVNRLAALGIVYSRTVKSTGAFTIPENFLIWNPTCHHKDAHLQKYLQNFRKQTKHLPLFYVWGHSYEFDRDNNWELIEEFCRDAGGDPDTWYATNIEICDYICALRALRFSADERLVSNPSAIDVWISVDGEAVKVPAGAVAQAL